MQVTLKLFASLTDFLPVDSRAANQVGITLPEQATVAAVIERFALPDKLVHLVLVNGSYIAPEARATRVLVEGDALAIWPPIAGG